MQYIKQLGLQRSGTNVVKALLEMNFKDVCVLTNYLGDKHSASSWSFMSDNLKEQNPADFDLKESDISTIDQLVRSRELPLVINIKDPVSWVNSYFKFQRKKFLFKNPGSSFDFTVNFADKVLGRYEQVVESWLELAKGYDKAFFFVHEEVVSGLNESRLENLQDVLGASPTVDFPLVRLDGYAKRGVDAQHGLDLINKKMAFDRNYHLEDGWRLDVPDDVMEFSENRAQKIYNKLEGLKELLYYKK